MICEFFDFLSPPAGACDRAAEEFAPNMQAKCLQIRDCLVRRSAIDGSRNLERFMSPLSVGTIAVARSVVTLNPCTAPICGSDSR